MENEHLRREDDTAIQIALFRYGVIGALVEQETFAPGEVSKLVRQLVERTHYLPGKGPIRVEERTVYHWLATYRTGGIEALRPKRRKDLGSSRVMEQATIERAIQLRKEGDDRWTSTLLDILKREGTLKDQPVPHRATLDRHLDKRGASRRQLGVFATKRTIKMKFENFGDLWVGDYHHGPLVLGTDGKPTTAKLGAFIDHATRYVVADRYYLSEKIGTLRDTLLRALLKWGRPKKAYVDNGSVYKAEQLAYTLATVGTHLIHSKPYYSQGRGVIERWWRVVKGFEDEVGLREELLTIHELNRLWEAYRELRYCEAVHSEIGKSPNEAIRNVTPAPIDPAVAHELFLVKADRKVNRKDATVSVEARRFLCDAFLRGRDVQVRYDPNDLSSVLIFHEGKRIQKAMPQALNATPEAHPKEPKEKMTQSVDYLALLRTDFDRKLLEHAKPLAYADLRTDPAFDVTAYLDTVSKLAGLKLGASAKQELTDFWKMYGPLPEELVRIGTEHAVRLSGRGRHPQIYLHAIRTLVLAHWRGPGKDKQ